MSNVELLKQFDFENLSEHDKLIALPFYNIANTMEKYLSNCEEKTDGLQMLIDARNKFLEAAKNGCRNE